MAEDGFRKYEPFFGKWKAGKELGKGAFGHVYEIYREDDTGERMVSALKVMHIPKEDALRTQMEIQPDTRAARAYFSAQIERMQEEIRILKKCRGHSNIVSYEEHMIVEESGAHAVGWDILIRMERLYPVTPRTFAQINATQYDVLRMWRDIANALIFCEDQNIIHRDIKPANILLSETGSYKLTDFGVARELMEQDQEASTRVGTEPYMAPEVYDKRNQKYDKRADLYSLGRVIYYYLNQNRHAFLPPYPQEITAENAERAELMRLGGEKIPRIEGVSKEINDLLLKSLAFRPANRPKSARELYRAIEKLLKEQGGELKRKPLRSQSAAGFAGTGSDQRNSRSHTESGWMRRRKAAAGVHSESGSETGILETWIKMVPLGSFTAISRGLSAAAAAICLAAGVLLIGYSRYIEKSGKRALSGGDAAVTAATSPETQWIPETEAVMFTELTGESAEEKSEKTPDESVETWVEAETEVSTNGLEEMDAKVQTDELAGLDTEVRTDQPTELDTEAWTDGLSELGTETTAATNQVLISESETETGTPAPTARLVGALESPQDGETASSNLKVKGWILVNEETGGLSARVDISLKGELVKSETLELTELSEKLFRKRQRDYQSDIAAVSGYEIKKTLDVAELEPGTYEVSFIMEETFTEEPAVSGRDTEENRDDADENNMEGSMEADGMAVLVDHVQIVLTEPETAAETEAADELSTHYRKDDYAIGLDLEDVSWGITANREQILVSGWINAPGETSLSMVYVIDSVSYIRSTIEEAGGSVRIIRAKRNLEQMDSALIGESVLDMEEAGFLILLDLPFLEDGTHTLQLSPNVGLKETGEDAPYDFAECSLAIDSTIALSEITDEEAGLTAAADAILQAWAAEFPQEEETELTEEALPE
ncbi:MAG: protein kinase [Lachnospiraceae bacterium]|nr:protein kinase [Lachnospiraceae bacterium]